MKNISWIIKITLFSITASAVFTLLSQKVIQSTGYLIAVLVLLVFIVIGVLFDIIGVAVAAAREAPFHAMASHRTRGAAQAIRLIRNANKVSSICNDVVGDIAGIISGTTAAFVASEISSDTSAGTIAVQLIVSGIVTGMTIGGKAIGKFIAMSKTNSVLLTVGRLASLFIRSEKKR